LRRPSTWYDDQRWPPHTTQCDVNDERTEATMKNWLRDQREYQSTVYDVAYEVFGLDKDARTDYVSMNLTAAMIELGEAYQEVPWKPWAKVNKEEVWKEKREKFIGEIVDTLFFLSNALTAVGCTDEELARAYAAKMGVNKKRQADGYDGISTKCTHCGAALDEPGMDVNAAIKNSSGQLFCSTRCELAKAGVVVGR